MEIGLLKERKIKEGRVALTPNAVSELVLAGHRVYVEESAGLLSGFEDSDYIEAGAFTGMSQCEVWGGAELIIKVKEPIKEEYEFIEEKHILFSYLHLANEPALIERLVETKCTAIPLENIEREGILEGLDPMSQIAGRLASNLALNGLYHSNKGNGILLGGINGSDAGYAVVIGGGISGMTSAVELLKHNVNVIVFDIDENKIAKINSEFKGKSLFAKPSNPSCITKALEVADVVIGAVLLPGLPAPKVITKEMLGGMKKGSVIVDIAIDQGGCVEGIRTTDWDKQFYFTDEGVKVFSIPNLPGAVPRTSSEAVSKVILPHALDIAKDNFTDSLKGAISINKGEIVDKRLG